MRAKLFSFILLIFVQSLSLAGNKKLAMIDDPDGFTNIRKGPGKNTEIVGKISKDDFFYCEVSSVSDWYKVIAQEWDRFGNQISGYIHKSRIKIIENTPLDEQNQIIENVLLKHKQLSLSAVRFFNKNLKSRHDSIEYKKKQNESENELDRRYDPILEVLPKYFCKSKDSTIIILFFDTIWADKGSADESPSFSIGECFLCDPDLHLTLVKQTKNKEKRNFIIDMIESGLANKFPNGDNEPDNPVYIKFKKKLEKLR